MNENSKEKAERRRSWRERTISLFAHLLPFLVALPVFFFRRIEAGQLFALLHLLHQPGFQKFMLGAIVCYEIGEILRDDDRAIVVCHDDVVGEDRAAAAADRLLSPAQTNT